MVNGIGQTSASAPDAVRASYAGSVTDEFIKPFVILDKGAPVATIKDGDVAICFNFRTDRCREIFLIKPRSLARRMIALPEDARRIVIGLSGGRDSTQALLVAVHAMDLLELPRTDITAVTMPGRFKAPERTSKPTTMNSTTPSSAAS